MTDADDPMPMPGGPTISWPEMLEVVSARDWSVADKAPAPGHVYAASDTDFTTPLAEVQPVPLFARRSWWQRLLRRPLRQVGWGNAPFVVDAPEVVWRSGGGKP